MVNYGKGRRHSLEKSLDRRGYTLSDKIRFYRTLRRHAYILMCLVIILLLFLNYTNITYINEHQCGLKSESQLNIDIETKSYKAPNSQGRENSSAEKELTAESVVQSTTFKATTIEIDDEKVEKENETIRSYQFRIPDFFELHPNLKRTVEPRYLLSNRRSNVNMVIGVPTVKRKEVSYLKSMLTSLFEALDFETQTTKNETLVVVMIAEVRITLFK